jgi:CubicO group peptidase (beta-lactamase class C family)
MRVFKLVCVLLAGSVLRAYEQSPDAYPSHTVAPAEHAWQFREGAIDPELGDRLKGYLTQTPITGLLVAKDDRILFESYQRGRTAQDRLMSQSMVKTIVGMLAGIAVSEHSIGSVNDMAGKYVSELRDSDYGKVKIVDLLHMSSGVGCQREQGDMDAMRPEVLATKCKTDAPAGTRFRYSAEDAQVLGLVVARATHTPLTLYLQQRVWRKIGTEAKATWTVNATGEETAYCCFNATLRDYARLGRLLAYDGNWNGSQLIPRDWVLAATTFTDGNPQLLPGKPIRFYGYGYQTWIFPGPRRMFVLLGANGQRIFVDPQSKLVLVQTAVMEKDLDPERDAETIRLWFALVHHYGGDGK